MVNDPTQPSTSRSLAMFSQMQTLEHAARISLADYRDIDTVPRQGGRIAGALALGAAIVAVFVAGLLLLRLFA